MDQIILTSTKNNCTIPIERQQIDSDSVACNDPPEEQVLSKLVEINPRCIQDSSADYILINETPDDIPEGQRGDSFEDKEYDCYLCSSTFPWVGSLRHHLARTHQIDVSISYFCVLCDYEYWNDDQKNFHLQIRHGMKVAESLCNVCGLQLSSRIESRSHQRKHRMNISCPTCTKKFASKDQLTVHAQSHLSALKPHVCHLCGKRFQNSKACILHRWRHQQQKCPKCESFLQEFEDESSLMAHLHGYHSLCGQKFQSFISARDKSDYELDLLLSQFEDGSHSMDQDDLLLSGEEAFIAKNIHSVLQLADSQLCKLTISEEELIKIKTYLNAFLGNKTVKSLWEERSKTALSLESILSRNDPCAFCNSSFRCGGKEFNCSSDSKEVFTSQKLLRTHNTSRKASSDSNDQCKGFVCSECGKIFSTWPSLSRHLVLSHNDPARRFKCKKCNKIMRTKTQLNDHLYKFHKISFTLKNFRCEICEKAFTSEKFLSLHSQIHENKRKDSGAFSFTCSKCDKIFIRKSNYLRHMENHNSTHVCSYCDAKFSSLSKISSHLMTHSSEMKERFPCSKCSLKFTYKSQLKIHLRTHTNEKPFVCEVCGKGFKRLQQCKVHHSLVHSSEKIHCPECDKKFGTEANLLRHRLVFHYNLRRWVCGVCGQNYGYSQDLRCHLLKKHEVKFNALENGQKKSRFEVYIIPELGSSHLSDDAKCRIKAVYAEEKIKLDNLQTKLSSHMSDQNQIALIKSTATGETVNRIVIDAKKGEEEIASNHNPSFSILVGENEPRDCLLCNTKLLLRNSTVLCGICGGSLCSSAHLNAHLLQKHAARYQCYMCSSLFASAELCIEHVTKAHGAGVEHPPLEAPISVQPVPPLDSSSTETVNFSLPLICEGKPAPSLQIVPRQLAVQVVSVPQLGPPDPPNTIEDFSKLLSKEALPTGILLQPGPEAVANPTPLNQVFLASAAASKSLPIGASFVPESCSVVATQGFFSQANSLNPPANFAENGIQPNAQLNVDNPGLLPSEPISSVAPIISLRQIKGNPLDLQPSEIQSVPTPSVSAASLLLTLSQSNDVCCNLSLENSLKRNLEQFPPSAASTAVVHACQQPRDSELLKVDDQGNFGSFSFNEGVAVVSDSKKPVECARIDISSTPCNLVGSSGTGIFIPPPPSKVAGNDANLDMAEGSSGVLCQYLCEAGEEQQPLEVPDNKGATGRSSGRGDAGLGGASSDPLSCSVCQKSFASLPKLKRHTRIHQKGKYVCHVCKKAFVENFNLKTHLLIHTNTNPLQCEKCDKSFRYYRDLKDHQNLHLDIFPHSCSACNLSFLRQKDLARHTKEQHNDCEYKCSICEKGFKRKAYLEKVHMALHAKSMSDNK